MHVYSYVTLFYYIHILLNLRITSTICSQMVLEMYQQMNLPLPAICAAFQVSHVPISIHASMHAL
jgi:hypothetical protein